jgi:hypothetical protein
MNYIAWCRYLLVYVGGEIKKKERERERVRKGCTDRGDDLKK